MKSDQTKWNRIELNQIASDSMKLNLIAVLRISMQAVLKYLESDSNRDREERKER